MRSKLAPTKVLKTYEIHAGMKHSVRANDNFPMANYILLVVIALAGFAEAPWWFVLVGGGALSTETLSSQYQFLRHNPRSVQQWEAWLYSLGQVAINVAFATAAYLVGWLIGTFS
jgi:hypothetical protein